MQGKGLSLRLGLLALVVVLIFGTLGGFSLAKDAFDDDYKDCPASTRLDAVSGLTIDRTDEDDEVRVAWEALDVATLSSLGPNGFRARLTVIVEGQDPRNVALGDTTLTVDDVDFTEALTVSVAVTLGNYVISDIREAGFTSGMPAPRFSTDIRVSANQVTAGPFTPITAATTLEEAATALFGDEAGSAEKAADEAEYNLLIRTTNLTDDVDTNADDIVDETDRLLQAQKDLWAAALENEEVGPANTARDLVISTLVEAQEPTVLIIDRVKARRAGYNRVIAGDDRAANVANKDALKDLGTFYYLGFNDLFDNWFIDRSTDEQRPRTPKFRVGLQHGSGDLDLDEADFANYRIVIEDSNGDLLGYQAETVAGGKTYSGNKIVFQDTVADVDAVDEVDDFLTTGEVPDTTKTFTNIRISNQVSDSGDAVSPYFARGDAVFSGDPGTNPSGSDKLSVGNVGYVNAGSNNFPLLNVIYADPPVEYFDFPSDVFEADGNYKIVAWAEDDDGTRISPQTKILLSVQESEGVGNSNYRGYRADNIRSWSPAGADISLSVYGFSIQKE